MKCRKCDSENAAGANYCRHCGEQLTQVKKRSLLPAVFLVVLAFGLSVCILSFFKNILFPFPESMEQEREIGRPAATGPRENTRQESGDKTEIAGRGDFVKELPAKTAIREPSASAPIADETPQNPPIGLVTLFDPWGNEIAVVSAVVVDGRWLALPVRFCLGAVRWSFRDIHGRFAAEIRDGLWLQDTAVALWRLDRSLPGESLPLAPWREKEETLWRSLVSEKRLSGLSLVPDWVQGDFLHVTVPQMDDEPGVFLQQGRVVGWSFGAGFEGGYLWGRPWLGDAEEKINRTVADFYETTFAGGREEKFAMAMAMGDEALPAERLRALIDAFLSPPKAAAEESLFFLQPNALLSEVRLLALEIFNQGDTATLIDLLDAKVVGQMRDELLLEIAVQVRVVEWGYEKSLDFLEESLADFPDGRASTNLQELHLQLYRLWADAELSHGRSDRAGAVLARGRMLFADDPVLHLIEVALFVSLGDWETAEDLLWRRQYPPSLQDRFTLLADAVSELKMREGKIVISFPPGAHQIHVTTTVNGRAELPFLIDTGASFVAVPAAFLGRIGLEINEQTPRRLVATAGGMKVVREVTLDSVELQGWVVRDVPAFVIDGSGVGEFGLLGLNFLNRFKMQLDSDKGVLILNPQ
ncbi:MAG: hypothetical protein BM485_02825 [Desulfobulbaceae bacterium DB1]|nr:MAG: hypothetical protein BM485_02825 [Desulfobulbaceae bacterium DB1]